MPRRSSGLWQIKRNGGLALVQEPKETRFNGMVENALANVEVDHVVPIEQMGGLLSRLVQSPARGRKHHPDKHMLIENRIAGMQGKIHDTFKLGHPSAYVCPECSGTLFELREGKLQRYRCRTGHAFSEGSLLAGQAVATEEALWTAMRALNEQADLLRRRAKECPSNNSRQKLLNRLAKQVDEESIQVRSVIEKNGTVMTGLRARSIE